MLTIYYRIVHGLLSVVLSVVKRFYLLVKFYHSLIVQRVLLHAKMQIPTRTEQVLEVSELGGVFGSSTSTPHTFGAVPQLD